MKIKFTKMHGAGNDFIIIDDRAEKFDLNAGSLIAKISARDKGIGCEGVLVIRLAQTFSGNDFSMIFFNPDGTRVGMCGNAARCVALYAYNNGIAGESQHILTDSGIIVATIQSSTPGEEVVSIKMPKPSKITEYIINGRKFFYLNTGVPHAVNVYDDELSSEAIHSIGSSVRYNKELFPEGTNVDFVRRKSISFSRFLLRTYERGVEAETGACGTGATASALVLMAQFGIKSPIVFEVLSGDLLEVSADFDAENALFSNVYLTGPARYVAEGHLDTSWYTLEDK